MLDFAPVFSDMAIDCFQINLDFKVSRIGPLGFLSRFILDDAVYNTIIRTRLARVPTVIF